MRRVGDDPRLRAGERDRAVPEVVDGHGAQRATHALARGEEHVHLARVRVRRDLVGVRDQPVGLLAAGAEHGDHTVPRLALGHDPLSGALEPLSIGDGGAAELHDHGPVAHPEREGYGVPKAVAELSRGAPGG